MDVFTFISFVKKGGVLTLITSQIANKSITLKRSKYEETCFNIFAYLGNSFADYFLGLTLSGSTAI